MLPLIGKLDYFFNCFYFDCSDFFVCLWISYCNRFNHLGMRIIPFLIIHCRFISIKFNPIKCQTLLRCLAYQWVTLSDFFFDYQYSLETLGMHKPQFFLCVYAHFVFRTEITITINWIRTHLEEDPQVRYCQLLLHVYIRFLAIQS